MTAGAKFKSGSQGRALDRGAARKRAFLDAAREVFLSQGYEAASVNDVVRIAGGSMATLYAQFGSKEGLFHAFVRDQHERFSDEMTLECFDHLGLEDGLQAMGEQYLRFLLDKRSLGFYRIVASEGRKFPPDMQHYIAGGADRARDIIANFLRAKGGVRDPDTVAMFLVDMWRARHHFMALADATYTLSEPELKRHIAAANALALDGARA